MADLVWVAKAADAPLVAGASQEILVTATNPNPGGPPVQLDKLRFDLRVGSNASDLVEPGTTDTIKVQVPAGWGKPVSQGGVFVVDPDHSPYKLSGDGLEFSFAKVTVNDQAGQTGIDITDGLSDPTAELDKWPAGFHVSDLQADPTNPTDYPASTTLTWSGSKDADYTLHYGDHPPIPVGPNGPKTIHGLKETTTFTLKVTTKIHGDPIEIEKQAIVTVNIPPPTIKCFTGEFALDSSGKRILHLSWDTEHTEATHGGSVTVSGDSSYLKPTGSLKIPAAEAQPAYTLTATNPRGESERTIYVELRQQGPTITVTDDTGKQNPFGGSVALSADAGDTALIGSNGDSGHTGAAWVFIRNEGAWIQQGPKLTAEPGANLGRSLALSADGNTALVGGWSADPRPEPPPWPPAPSPLPRGAAWVFVRSNGTWSTAGIKLTGGDDVSNFGWDVALSGDGNTALIVGTDNKNVAAQARVFTRSGDKWTQSSAQLTCGNATSHGQGFYGYATALSADGGTALIGSAANNGGAGAAWVFTQSNGAWKQQGAPLTGQGESFAGLFGWGVALSADGNTALVGGSGAVWVFTRSGGTWTPGPKITPPGPSSSFGSFVALSSDATTALIGGLDGNSTGTAWVFAQVDGKWTQQGVTELTGSGTGNLPWRVAVSSDGSTALAGGGNFNGPGAAWAFTKPRPSDRKRSTDGAVRSMHRPLAR